VDIQQANLVASRQQAVVIGASIAGLLAGRVLSEYFERVIIVERDSLPEHPEARKGVPQGLHVHSLLQQGSSILSEFFPDLLSNLVQEGSIIVDPVADIHWYHLGVWKNQFSSSIKMWCQSRPFLEHHVRRCLTAISNIHFVDRCDVTGLCATDDNARVIGVRARYSDKEPRETELAADLVIDASGRGSQASRWLSSLGYGQVQESVVKIDVGYATRIYRRPQNFSASWKMLAVYPWFPARKRVGTIVPIEGDRWLVTLAGFLRDYPPDDEAEFLEYACGLAVPDVYEAIRMAEPITPVFTHRLPSDRRRYYERLSRFPGGFLILGDALCTFNPVYAQGITVAALEANVLNECLRRLSRLHFMQPGLPDLARRFQKAAAKVINVPWLMATSEDFRYPEVAGHRLLSTRLLNWYTGSIIRMGAYHRHANLRFHEVMHMRKHLITLFNPALIFSVLRYQLRILSRQLRKKLFKKRMQARHDK
jgi:2-polyprenyl-6-methoxyphenol hydroxylase-like FAD-dependent oxidoreductase